MKIVFEKVVPPADCSFALLDKRAAAFDGRFHFHPEFEITLIEASSGRRLVGDSIDAFKPDDLVLLGENLPHRYVSECPRPGAQAVAKVIQFRADLFGEKWLRMPEFKPIASLLRRAGRGLKFDGDAAAQARELIARIFATRGSKRLLLLVELLDGLSRDAHALPIASAGYRCRISSREGDLIDRALLFLDSSFREPLGLNDLCQHLHLSPATCNRLLRKAIGRSFKTALIEIRISHACRVLLETDQSVLQAAYASGFSNLSNFNRRFKELKGYTPRTYRDLLKP